MLTSKEKQMSIRRRKGFGPDQVIDLDKYENRWTEEEIQSHVKRGKFITFKFLDLTKYGGDYYHPDLLNIAIRYDGNRDNADEGICKSYKKKGWQYGPFPPIVDISDIPKDGRTRIRAAIKAGESFIVVAVFDYPEEEDEAKAYVQSLSEGLIGNDDLISRPTKYKDIFEAGLSAVKHGGIPEDDKTAIAKLVIEEFEAERFLDSNEIPLLVDDICEAVAAGQDAIWLPTRAEVINYLSKSPDVPSDACLEGDVCINGKKVFVYAAPSNTNQGRLWGKLAEEIPEESYVVLYTTKRIPSKIKKGYEDFVESVDKRYEECFEIVNRTCDQHGGMIKFQAPTKRPWEILGVIPQLNNDETHDSLKKMNRLIKLEDYC